MRIVERDGVKIMRSRNISLYLTTLKHSVTITTVTFIASSNKPLLSHDEIAKQRPFVTNQGEVLFAM